MEFWESLHWTIKLFVYIATLGGVAFSCFMLLLVAVTIGAEKIEDPADHSGKHP